MKIKFSFAVIVLILITQLSSSAQTLVGGKIGLINSNFNMKYKPNSFAILFTFENKVGIGASFFVQKYLTKKLSLDMSAQYGNFGTKLTDQYKFNVHYLSVPVMVTYDIFQNDMLAFNLHSGFSPSFFAGGNSMAGDQKEKIESGKDITGFDLFWEIGAGFVFHQSDKFSIKADVNLLRGLTNVEGNDDGSRSVEVRQSRGKSRWWSKCRFGYC